MNKDNLETIIEGYKVFNPDWTCRNFKYEVGKTYEHDGDIEVCEAGFHFCQKVIDCFNYYYFDNKNKVAKIEAIGLIKTDGDKSVTNKITIVKEIEWEELLNIVNIGNNNIGYGNTGDYNTGSYNTGDYNIGSYNTGDYNIENCNTGYRNEGCCNEGCWNTGNYNIGNCNSGDWNIGDYNSGVFCTDVPKIRMFNKETDLTYEDWINSEARNILKRNSYLTKWIHIDDMTEEEKENNPGYEINNGYLKVFTFEEMCKNMWNNLTDEEKKIIIDIPNFDADIFKEITGIEVIKLKIKECNIVDKQEYTNCCGNCKECDEYHKMLCNSLYEEE
ncbi:TPA: pentapeptide repeat-containing protein [Clostridioides difficile]|uniref:pentapeptide repeat-containing protein n=2 Tax=Clostridioides difficile TaxID=1496 RepID=UPI00016C6175|nr:pentapeptide repeat-containing protein [Clostridioides difficile]EJA6621394.1 pentapeptide repeat-containing protein [Clostridioides difficile]ELX4517418.1 pentapeptide repeat-containing protein [Clostridioides difficile]EQH27355.1 pentapeptide repeats family protein [Clostridioides difficile DA00212]EQJ06314.1 pentapeptide repeats family protein [Clostridioides difficile P8]EQJ49182.1 pentapeptide repeats family protein [Clostridioides difficile P25]